MKQIKNFYFFVKKKIEKVNDWDTLLLLLVLSFHGAKVRKKSRCDLESIESYSKPLYRDETNQKQKVKIIYLFP